MRAPSYIAIGAVAYLAFLVATMPASVAVERARRALPLDVRADFDEVGGTIWNGSLRVHVTAPGDLTLDRVAWRFLPARLAAGEIAFAIEATSPGVQARLDAARGFAGWRARDLAAQADAATLVAFVPVLAAFRPAGPLEVTAPSLEWSRTQARGEAKLEWHDAATSLADLRPLGSYRATWRGDGDAGRIAVTTLHGPLQVTGEGTTNAQGAQFDGEARAEPQAARALAPLLDLIGPPRPDGARAIHWRAK